MVDGAPTHLRGLTIDITARKKNEEALVASEARYRVLADLNPQAIWMGAPDGSITYANQNFLDYLGLTIEDLRDAGWLSAFQPKDRQRVLETWNHSVATGEDFDLEARMIRARDGHARWWWVRAQPVRDESGKILHWLGVAIGKRIGIQHVRGRIGDAARGLADRDGSAPRRTVEQHGGMVELIDAERQCCPFLTFVLQVPAHKNALILEIKSRDLREPSD